MWKSLENLFSPRRRRRERDEIPSPTCQDGRLMIQECETAVDLLSTTSWLRAANVENSAPFHTGCELHVDSTRVAFVGIPSITRRYDPIMRPIWKGALSFGLVNIPVHLSPAI